MIHDDIFRHHVNNGNHSHPKCDRINKTDIHSGYLAYTYGQDYKTPLPVGSGWLKSSLSNSLYLESQWKHNSGDDCEDISNKAWL